MNFKFPAIAIALRLVVSVQTQSNFSGTRNFKEKVHVQGPEYSNSLPQQINVDQRKDSLVLVSVNLDNGGAMITSHQAIPMNGKATIINSFSSKRRCTSSLAWSADKKLLRITTIFSMPENLNEVDFSRVVI